MNRRNECAFFFEKRSNQASRLISTGPLNPSRSLHAQPINQVVCLVSLGTYVRETISWDGLGT